MLRAVIVNDDCAVPVTEPDVITDEIAMDSCHGDAASDKENGFGGDRLFIPDARTCHPVGTVPPRYHERCRRTPARVVVLELCTARFALRVRIPVRFEFDVIVGGLFVSCPGWLISDAYRISPSKAMNAKVTCELDCDVACTRIRLRRP